MYQLADRLKMTVAVIQEMTVIEFNGWMAYFNIINSEK
jgi:hypothetical protein